MRDEGDRFVAWRLDDTSVMPGPDLEEERMERALLAYAHRSATHVGAEWFAAEFARREEDERLQLERAAHEREADVQPDRDPAPEISLVDASVEDAVIGGTPTSLGLDPSFVERQRVAEAARLDAELVRPEVPQPTPPPVVLPAEPAPQPAVRHPHVPRPPAPEPARQPKRRRRRKELAAPTPSFVISAPEWARMSPGARRLYGLDASPPA